MQTNLAEFIKDTPQGQTAETILRKCVHCGFCTATCPTYQLLNDELDGPRGRIYQIKQVLEGEAATRTVLNHLDRCLTCRSCETTCPSGVQYSHLLDIGREVVEQQVGRPVFEKLQRTVLRRFLKAPYLFTPALRLSQALKPVMPGFIADSIPARVKADPWPQKTHQRRMLILDGCVQPALDPQINAATARVLDHLGVELVRTPKAGCCGSLPQHLSAPDEALDDARRNIDAWWPHIENGIEAIVMTASGCGTQVKDYGHLLANDSRYADKAARVAGLTKDISELLANEDLSSLRSQSEKTIAFHPPCTLQHGQKIRGVVEKILQDSGYKLVPVRDSHLCCGSAGTYSILQADISEKLLNNKLDALQEGKAEMIVTANIGCQTHLSGAADLPVQHWINLLAEQI